MRYDIDELGYILNCFWGCYSGTCNEYTGEIPEGYTDLTDWADNEIINAWFVNAEGNLEKDSGREAELKLQQEIDEIDYTPLVYKDLMESQESLREQNEIGEAEGNPIIITDGVNYSPYIEIHNIVPAQGRVDLFSQGNQMLRDDSASETINGVTFTSIDGEISISGTATKAFEYTISGSAENTDPICGIRANENHYINVGSLTCELRYFDGESTHIVYNGSSGTINISACKNVTHAVLLIPAGAINKNVKPMLNRGNTAMAWEEYKSSHICMNFEEYAAEFLSPSNTLYPSDTLYPLGIDSNTYICVSGAVQMLIDGFTETVIGKGNVKILSDNDIVYTTQPVSLYMQYKTTTIIGDFDGEHSGSIGGLDISANSVYSGDLDGDGVGDFRLSSEDFSRVINDVIRDCLRFAIGSNFGIKNDGTIYASNAQISGEINATSGSFTGKIIAESGEIAGFRLNQINGGERSAFSSVKKVNPYSDGYDYQSVVRDISDTSSTNLAVGVVQYPTGEELGYGSGIDSNGRLTGCNGLYAKSKNSGYKYYINCTESSGGMKMSQIVATSGMWSPAYAESSDRRLKQNIEAIEIKKSKDFIYGLIPVSYEYKDKPGKTKHGFIAQDVQEVQYDGWTPCTLYPDNDMLGLNYTELIADLVKVVQSQHEEIEELKEKVNTLMKEE